MQFMPQTLYVSRELICNFISKSGFYPSLGSVGHKMITNHTSTALQSETVAP